MTETIIIPQHHSTNLTEYAEKQPYEMCALLIGWNLYNKNNLKKPKYIQVHHMYFTDNTEKSPVHFTISNEQLIEGYKFATKKHMEVVGIFHSHPNNKAWPSITDEKFMKTNPGVWIIYSGTEKNMRAFKLNDNEKPKEIWISNDKTFF